MKKQTPLHLAIFTNNAVAASQLLKNNADLNKQDSEGNTALHFVAKYATTKRMLEEISKFKKSFDFSIKNNDGKTPLNIVEPNCFCQSDIFKDFIKVKVSNNLTESESLLKTQN